MSEAIIERAKEIIAAGCGCDRHCKKYDDDEAHCGCLEEAKSIHGLYVNNGWKESKK